MVRNVKQILQLRREYFKFVDPFYLGVRISNETADENKSGKFEIKNFFTKLIQEQLIVFILNNC